MHAASLERQPDSAPAIECRPLKCLLFRLLTTFRDCIRFHPHSFIENQHHPQQNQETLCLPLRRLTARRPASRHAFVLSFGLITEPTPATIPHSDRHVNHHRLFREPTPTASATSNHHTKLIHPRHSAPRCESSRSISASSLRPTSPHIQRVSCAVVRATKMKVGMTGGPPDPAGQKCELTGGSSSHYLHLTSSQAR